uniref:Polypyrimidine tract-binding protein 3 n=1 Tax=Lygus hesperus TaxID=30085 RepID=A0A0A9WHN9_LYGHE
MHTAMINGSSSSSLFQGNKRGSDVLGVPGQEGSMSPQHNHSDNNNDAKKAKLDKTQIKPSRVIHIRNIPNEVTEAEIIHMGIPFGRVTNVLVLKGKNQAFLEMGDELAASTMVSYFGTCMPQLRGRAVYVQFSNHKELKTDQSHSNAVSSNHNHNPILNAALFTPLSEKTALGLLALQSFGQGNFQQNASAQAALQAAQALTGGNDIQGGPNTVLRVVVEHMMYPISLDIIYQIFSRYGKVLKIVTFTKNNSFQVLVQFQDVVSAQTAKMALDGQNVYNGCCTLRIEYSKLTSLNVKYNNDKSRDYTNPGLPNGEGGESGGGGLQADQLLPQLMLTNPLARRFEPRLPDPSPPTKRFHLNDAASQGIKIWETDLPNFLGGQGVLPSPFGPLPGLTSPLAAQFTPGSPVTGLPLTAGGFAMPTSAATALAAQTALARLPGGQLSSTSCVLLVSNLNEEIITTDALFVLFGVYGDVQRVKILYNKKDSALIQVAEPHQANLAIMHLDKVRLYGKQMRVMSSKHQTVQLPKDGQPDAGLTKDYTSSNLHRFKKPGSKNYQNIYPPSSTLHLSNIPPNITEEDLKEAFTEAGFTVTGFKFFPKDKKMALLELPSVDEAVEALIKMHNHQLSDQNHLRVSFSKSNIQASTLR